MGYDGIGQTFIYIGWLSSPADIQWGPVVYLNISVQTSNSQTEQE